MKNYPTKIQGSQNPPTILNQKQKQKSTKKKEQVIYHQIQGTQNQIKPKPWNRGKLQVLNVLHNKAKKN